MANKFTTSCIITNYNYTKYIIQALQSVLSQSICVDEILVIDDCSTDSSLKTVKDYIKSLNEQDQNKILVLKTEKNGGPAAARNLGIKNATGDILFFLDADDIYLPHKVSKSLEVFTKYPDVQLVYSDYAMLSGSDLQREFKMPYDWRFLTQVCIVSTDSAYRRSVFNKVGLFDERPLLRGTEDYHMYLRIGREYMIWHVPESLFIYRVHPQQITQSTNHERFKLAIDTFKKELFS